MDLVGDDSMEVDLTFKCTRSGKTITMHPDGRKCRLCILRDDNWDPCAFALQKKKVYCRWGKTPLVDTGKTNGNHCAYCVKYYSANHILFHSH